MSKRGRSSNLLRGGNMPVSSSSIGSESSRGFFFSRCASRLEPRTSEAFRLPTHICQPNGKQEQIQLLLSRRFEGAWGDSSLSFGVSAASISTSMILSSLSASTIPSSSRSGDLTTIVSTSGDFTSVDFSAVSASSSGGASSVLELARST